MDREFSYLEMLRNLVEEQVNFVIRLNLGSRPPKFWDAEGKEVVLALSPGETVIHSGVWYKGEVGVWQKRLTEPLWGMSNLEPQRARQMYLARMKIEETFRDLKGVLGMTRLMNQWQESMEKMVKDTLASFAAIVHPLS